MNEPRPDRKQYPYFGIPPARQPKPADEVPALKGKRVVLSTPEGFVYDMRAISDIRANAQGHNVIAIVTEEGYFRWMFTGKRPKSEDYPARLVWVE